MEVQFVEFKKSEQARESPCPFGTFCLIYNGKIIADHPISRTRFKNIMKKMGVRVVS
jgi:hypothetical protein